MKLLLRVAGVVLGLVTGVGLALCGMPWWIPLTLFGGLYVILELIPDEAASFEEALRAINRRIRRAVRRMGKQAEASRRSADLVAEEATSTGGKEVCENRSSTNW